MTRAMSGLWTSLAVALVVTSGGCQPWTGNYTGTWSDPYASTTLDASFTQISSAVLVGDTIHVDTKIGLPCDWTMSGCSGTATSGTSPTFHAPGCTFSMDPADVDCGEAYGTSFTSDVDGTSLALSAGSVSSFTYDLSFWPPSGGPLTFPVPLARTP